VRRGVGNIRERIRNGASHEEVRTDPPEGVANEERGVLPSERGTDNGREEAEEVGGGLL